MVQFHLRRSKCDQAGKGADVVVGKTGSDVCPVTAILEFIELRGLQAGPFFLDSTKKPVLKPWFVAQLREVLCLIGFPPMDLAGHSFRIGAATTASLVGLEDSMIQTLGRCNMSEPQRSGWPPCLPRWHLPQRLEPWSFSPNVSLPLLLVSIIMFK